MNEYDSNRIYDLAKQIDYKKTDNHKEADCYVTLEKKQRKNFIMMLVG